MIDIVLSRIFQYEIQFLSEFYEMYRQLNNFEKYIDTVDFW